MPYTEGVKQRAQFYFSLSGLPAAEDDEPRSLRFRVINQSNQARLLSYGHKPVYLVLSQVEFIALKKGQIPVFSQRWQRVPSDVRFRRSREGICMAWEFTVGHNFRTTDHVLFAYAQPFTRTDIERSILEFEAKCRRLENRVYFHKEVLIESLEGHPMHILTVTGNNAVSSV